MTESKPWSAPKPGYARWMSGRSPDAVREAIGRSKGTTVLALGAARGEAFTPSEWELKHVP